MMGASFIMARAMEMRQHVHAVRRDASQKEVMSLAMVDFPLPEGPTRSTAAAPAWCVGQNAVGSLGDPGLFKLLPQHPVAHKGADGRRPRTG